MALSLDELSPLNPSLLEPVNCDAFKMNLFNDMTTENTTNLMSTVCDEKLATFLRIRPLENLSIDDSPYKVIDSNLLCVDVEENACVNNGTKRMAGKKRKFFNFTEIFDDSISQKTIFSKCCLPLIEDVLNGTNTLIFCFGTTSSGKSYTMRGPPEDPTTDPGLIPLALKKIFTSRKFIDEPLIGKSKFCDISLLNQEQQDLETQFKESILSSSCCRSVSAFSLIEKCNNFNEDGYQYICYISYFEIYNGLVYDLLVPSTGGRGSALSLFPDDKQRYFIKDLKSIMAATLTEALQIYSFGWTNLQRNIQETGLNKNSSRSHSFLSITLIKFKEDEGRLLESQVSHLTLGDLAGSERQNKTHSEGLRVKEGGNINVSLMHLKECFNQTKLSQKNPNRNFVIPFRNSSLTKFFQPYLTGTGRVWMIVNINPSPTLLHETLGSLDLGETASHISVNSTYQMKLEESRKRMTQMWLESSQRWSSFAGKSKILDVPEVVIEEDCDLKGAIGSEVDSTEVDAFNRDQNEDKIRREVIAQFEELLSELAKDHEKDLQLTRDNYEKTMEARLALSDKKYQSMIRDMQSKLDQLTNELFDARENVVHLEEEIANNRPVEIIKSFNDQQMQTETLHNLEEEIKRLIAELEDSREETKRSVNELQSAREKIVHLENTIKEITPVEVPPKELKDQEVQIEPVQIPCQNVECQTDQVLVPLEELTAIQDARMIELREMREELLKEAEENLELLRQEAEKETEIWMEKVDELQSEIVEKQKSPDTIEQEAQTEQPLVPSSELEKLKDTHSKEIEEMKDTHFKEIDQMKDIYSKEIEKMKELIKTSEEAMVKVKQNILEERDKLIEEKKMLVDELQKQKSIPTVEVTESFSSDTLSTVKERPESQNASNHQSQSIGEMDDTTFTNSTISPKRSRYTIESNANRSTRRATKGAASIKKSREITIDANCFLPASVSGLAKKKRKDEDFASPSTEITNAYLQMFQPTSVAKKSAKKSAKKQPRKSTRSIVVPEPEPPAEEVVEDDEIASLLLSRKKDNKKKSKEEDSTVKIPTKRKKLPTTQDHFLETTISDHFEDEPAVEPNIKGGRVLRPRRKIKF